MVNPSRTSFSGLDASEGGQTREWWRFRQPFSWATRQPPSELGRRVSITDASSLTQPPVFSITAPLEEHTGGIKSSQSRLTSEHSATKNCWRQENPMCISCPPQCLHEDYIHIAAFTASLDARHGHVPASLLIWTHRSVHLYGPLCHCY